MRQAGANGLHLARDSNRPCRRINRELARHDTQAKNPKRSAAQLRIVMRTWRQQAWWGLRTIAVSVLGLIVCWYLRAHGFWWFLSATMLVSGLIEVSADINAYFRTKKRIADIEKAL
jgi:hypothetical protein